MSFDPVALELWSLRLTAVTEEMAAALGRAARSPTSRERRDHSCAIFDGVGRMVAQAAHCPAHLGAAPLSVRAAIAAVPLRDGECVMLSDPHAGGAHLSDVTLVSAVDASDGAGGSVRFYLSCCAHHADVGGLAPASFALGAHAAPGELPEAEPPVIAVGPRYRQGRLAGRPPALTADDEGARFAPALLTSELVERFASLGGAPDDRRGDLAAQQACLAVGRQRLLALCDRHGPRDVAAHGDALRAHAARIMRGVVAAIPTGVYAFADSLDDDGAGTAEVGVRVRIVVAGGRVMVDFSDSDDESPGAFNAVFPVTLSAVLYCFRLLCPEDTPANDGLLEPLEVVAPAGSIVNARPPRAVACNVETSQRIVDVVLGALAQALPERIPAASCGTLSTVMLRGLATAPFAYDETVPGGAGGGPDGDGACGVPTHMTNTCFMPVEALEEAVPVRVVRSAVRRGSGGRGRHDGGDGVEQVIEFLAPATVTLVGERRRRPPYGLLGGGPGAVGEDFLERGTRIVRLPSKCTFEAELGDRLTVRTPGGGGWGDARKKPPGS